MAVESDEDLAAFFNDDEFAVAGTYTRLAGGGAVTVTYIYDRPVLVDAAAGGDGHVTTARKVQVLRSLLAAAPAEGDTVVVTGEGTFTVRVATLDPTGKIWTIDLKAT